MKTTKPKISIAILYGIFLWFGKLIAITLFTYVFSQKQGSLQDIGDIINSNLTVIFGTSAAAYALFLHALGPLISIDKSDIFSFQIRWSRIQRTFLQGTALAAGFVAAQVVIRQYRFLGFFIPLNEIASTSLILTVLCLSALALFVVEEYILRHHVGPWVQDTIINWGASLHHAEWSNLLLCSAFTVLWRWYQFSLSWVGALNMGLLSLVGGLLFRETDSTLPAVSLYLGIGFVFHGVLSLSLFGQDISGIWLLQPIETSTMNLDLLTGGASGPLEGLSFSAMLFIILANLKSRERTLTNG